MLSDLSVVIVSNVLLHNKYQKNKKNSMLYVIKYKI